MFLSFLLLQLLMCEHLMETLWWHRKHKLDLAGTAEVFVALASQMLNYGGKNVQISFIVSFEKI